MVLEEDRKEKKDLIREIINELHQGLPVEEAQQRIEREVGTISSAQIAEIEQSLIEEGMSANEIRRFCNVHALMFEAALGLGTTGDRLSAEGPAHPVNVFEMENREIEKITSTLRDLSEDIDELGVDEARRRIAHTLEDLSEIEAHYSRKEQVLFPYLEKYGFTGPTMVMWGKDDEVRDLLKAARGGLDDIEDTAGLVEYVEEKLAPLVDEAEGMVQKEENILFPTSLEKLSNVDWAEILRGSDEVGYAFIDPPEEAEELARELQGAVEEHAFMGDEEIVFPSGSLNPEELLAIFNCLPVELTFVGPDDRVKYFSEGPERIFVRTRAVIGREVKHCHPPGSVDLVEEILRDFKAQKRDSADFWLEIGTRFIYIVFHALRTEDGEYLGTLEVAQDATRLRSLTGQRRLLDEAESQED
ncbi:MAG: DUF438 domain-containing protein [Bacillota bacterium]